jgi:choline dehydrogenase-like flavoprotein
VKLFRSAVEWDYMTEPQKELNGRQIYWPRGKMLGGSSSMNARMWVRGFAADYDEWGELAGDQWSFDQMPPYFDRIEARPLVISPHGARAARPQRGSRRPRKAATASNHRIPMCRRAFARRW